MTTKYFVLTARDARATTNMEIFEVDKQWMLNLIEEDEMDYESAQLNCDCGECWSCQQEEENKHIAKMEAQEKARINEMNILDMKEVDCSDPNWLPF